MNFIVGNYTSFIQTEPMYINATLGSIGCKSTVWNPSQISAYDIFDLIKPNYYITHITKIMDDVISYVQENGNVELILNITGVTQEIVTQAEQFLKEKNIPIAFLFTNAEDPDIKSKARLVKIGLGADIFLNTGSLRYSIDIGQIVSSKDQIKNYDCSYHSISCNKSLEDSVDICLPIYQLSNIYSNYKEIAFRGFESIIPQSFYDAVFYGNKVYCDIDDINTKSELSDKIKKVLRTEIDICDKNTVDSSELRRKILDRHTCLHRVKSLLSQLPANDYLSKIDTLIGGLK